MEDDIITIIIASSTKEIKKISVKRSTLKYLKLVFWGFLIVFICLIGSVIYISKSNTFLKSRITVLEKLDIERERDKQLQRMLAENEKAHIAAAFDSLKSGQVESLAEVASEEVNITEIAVTKNDSVGGIQISFKLNNVKMVNSISGYAMVTGLRYKLNENLYATYPSLIQLDQDYTPLNYRDGESFAIQYFKLIDVVLRPPTLMEKIDFFVVTVYSRDGGVFFRNIFNLYDYIENY